MNAFFLGAAIAILVSASLALLRAVRGPTVIDRIVAVNVVGTKTIAVILLMGLIHGQVEFFIDIAFTYALINFIGTLAFSKYFTRKGVHQEGEA